VKGDHAVIVIQANAIEVVKGDGITRRIDLCPDAILPVES
jgi:hypothetical protein